MTLNSGESDVAAAEVDAEGSLSRAITWRTSNPMIATVSSTGRIVGVAPGQTTVSALSVADTTKRADIAVTVLPAPAISVSPAAVSLGTGNTRTLVATVNVMGGQNRDVTWRTSNGTVATVSQEGVVTAVSIGAATITAVSVEDTLRRASSAITVVPIVRSVSVTPAAAGVSIGGSLQLSAALTADPGISTNIIWRSSNTAAAVVSNSGLVTGISADQVTITALSAADTLKRASATITVTSTPVSVAITQSSVSLSAGQSTTLQAVVSGNPGTSQTVTWSTSNPAVVTVSAAGVVTGVADGSATITATSQADASKSASVSAVVSSRLVSSWAASRLTGPLYEDVLSIAAFSASAAFSVNVVGDVYRWDGNAWVLSARGSNFGTQFTSVHGSSVSNVIAVGTRGISARFDGSHWTPVTTGTSNNLLDVFVEPSGTAYASGSNGTIIRFNGSSWSAMNSGSLRSLNGIWSNGSTAVAVGSSGEVLRLVSGSWQQQTVPTSENLYSVSGASASNIVAVGTFGSILRFNGSVWTSVSANGSSADFYTVDAASNGRYYIASDDGVLQLDGSSVVAVNTPYKPRIFSISVDVFANVWASGQRGSVFRSTGGAPFTTVSIAPDLLDVWSTSATNAWIVGEFGFIYRWNGSTWTRQTTPTTATLNTVWGSGPNDAYAAGDDGTMLRWNGSTWSNVTIPGSSSVYGIWGSSSSNVFAVMSGGDVLRFNGSAWSVSTTSSFPLWAVYGTSATDVHVSGANGTLMRFNGVSWSTQSPPGTGILAGLWLSGNNNVLAVGAEGSAGIAFRYNGSSWSTQSINSNRVLTSIWGPSANDVYATGDQGAMFRYDGTSWLPMTTGTTDLLWSMSGAPTGGGGGFAVGYNGTILTGSGSSGFMTSAMRMLPRADLEPSAQATRDPRGLGPVPSGAARRTRKDADASATVRTANDTRVGLQAIKFGARARRR
ncbi:MAG TPA: Ig-like domain-containing protein [Gemmatimonas sp.]|nr:Ig-like domain-containing protein [Gemmatimonas sp.]